MLDLVTGGWHACDRRWSSERSAETHAKIYVPQRGSGWYDCGAGRHELRPGSLYLIPGDRIHAYHCPKQLELWWVHVRPLDPHLRQRLSELDDLVCFSRTGRQPVWELLTDYFSTRPLTTTLALHSWALGLLSELPLSTSPADRRLDEVRAWIERHAMRNPSLAEIARQAAMSPSQLARLAQREWRESPHALVQRLRIQAARDLLLSTDLTVAAIAQRTSFADAPSLTKAFRKLVGQPPHAWRRNAQP